MEREWILDMEILQTKVTNRSRTGAMFKSGKVFVYDANYKQGFGIKSSYHQVNAVNVKLQKGRKNYYDSSVFDLTAVHLPHKYQTPIKLDVMKLQDIKALLPYIPPHHTEFMERLITEQEGLSDVPYVDDHDPEDDFLDYC